MNDSVLLIGSGGHASVLLEMLIEEKVNILGYVSPLPAVNQKLFSDFRWFKSDEDILLFDKLTIKLVNGIGSLPGYTIRADFYDHYKGLGYSFATLVSKEASVSRFAILEEGVQVMRGAMIQTGTSIGYNSIVNTGSIVDHDCSIGSNNHIAPGVTLSGQVHTKEFVHVGTGASIIQGINIARSVVVGAGAIITKNVEVEGSVCFPVRTINKVIK